MSPREAECPTDRGSSQGAQQARALFRRARSRGAAGGAPGVCAAEATLLLAGRGDAGNLRKALDDFLQHWDQLERRRKQPGTHAPPHGVAPYYFFYAHMYAALAIELLPDTLRPRYRARLLELLFRVREEGGGWNDRVFARSESYGTATSLLALLQPDLPRPQAWPAPEKGPAGK